MIMKYRIYLRVKVQEDNWVTIGENHDILWDYRDFINASCGWRIINQENLGKASDLIPKLRRGIIELEDSPETYLEFERAHGLGTTDSVLQFYKALINDCERYPFSDLCGCVAY